MVANTLTIKYDNCKDYRGKCRHAGEDREFVCLSGISCKVVYTPDSLDKAAKDFTTAIKEIASKPQNLDNLEGYLRYHFPEWLKKFASTPDDIAAEMKAFAEMEI